MQVRDIMTSDPECCTPDTPLQEAARLMVDCNCGAIPVVSDTVSHRLVGIITDRDITCRAVAKGLNPLQMKVADCMTTSVATVAPEASLEECCNIMEQHSVRRVPVVDASGRCVGIVAQADIAANAPEEETAEVVREISLAA